MSAMPYDVVDIVDFKLRFEEFLSGLPLLEERLREGFQDMETFEQSGKEAWSKIKERLALPE